MSFIATSLRTAAEGAEHTRELPLNPYVIGGLTLLILLVMVFGVLSMGKGRDYNP